MQVWKWNTVKLSIGINRRWYFRGRNFRKQKLLRDQKIAKFWTKTFTNSKFWNKFCVKNFRKNQKTFDLQGKKLSRMATILFFFFFLFLSSTNLQILNKVQARHEVLKLRFLPFRVRFIICYCVIIFWSWLFTTKQFEFLGRDITECQ